MNQNVSSDRRELVMSERIQLSLADVGSLDDGKIQRIVEAVPDVPVYYGTP